MPAWQDQRVTDAIRPSLDEVRQHHLDQVNAALRRPGMYGDETALLLLIDALAFVEGQVPAWHAERDRLSADGAFTALGVRGAYNQILPDDQRHYDAVASIYAEIAHRRDWLILDRALSGVDYDRLRDTVEAWCSRDRSFADVLATFGDPSVRLGSGNPYFPKTLAYTTDEPTDPLICFHLWNAFDQTAQAEDLPSIHPEPVLLAVRHRTGRFLDTFTFTPEGARRRPTATL